MEKIYIEDNNNNKQSKFRQIFNSQLSNKLSVAMILVAFASFLAMGFSGVGESYAIVVKDVPNEFTIKTIDSDTDMFISAYLDPNSVDPESIMDSNNQNVYVDRMINSNDTQVFCLNSEKKFPTSSGIVYKKSTSTVDSGVTYILRNSYPEDLSLVTGFTAQGNKDVGTWVTQIATWDYLTTNNLGYENSKYASLSSKFKQANFIYTKKNNLTTGQGGYKSYNSSDLSRTFYSSYVANLVTNANKYKGVVNKLNVNREDNNISVEDDKYYKTSFITVEGGNLVFTDDSTDENSTGKKSDKYNGFHLEFDEKKVPSGIQFIGEDGKEISKDVYTTKMPTTKFYIRVPISSLKEGNKNLSVNIVGDYMENQGIIYTPSDSTAQSVVLLAYVNQKHPLNLNIDLTYTPDVPDTGMSSAQSIYFIGLVILLCGIGIIYANTKEKQEQ